MQLPALRPRKPSRQEEPGEAGVSIVELVISMLIFSVVIGIYFGALVSMANTTSRAQDTVDASDALRSTFNALDHQVRYATSINRPVEGVSGAWYVEFEATNLPQNAPDMCYQWRLDPASNVIAYRTWKEDGVTVTAWHSVAWDVVAPGGGSPFDFTAATGTVLAQKLTVNLQVEGKAGIVLAQQGTTFVARNSSDGSKSNLDTDNNGVSDTEVCTIRMDRP